MNSADLISAQRSTDGISLQLAAAGSLSQKYRHHIASNPVPSSSSPEIQQFPRNRFDALNDDRRRRLVLQKQNAATFSSQTSQAATPNPSPPSSLATPPNPSINAPVAFSILLDQLRAHLSQVPENFTQLLSPHSSITAESHAFSMTPDCTSPATTTSSSSSASEQQVAPMPTIADNQGKEFFDEPASIAKFSRLLEMVLPARTERQNYSSVT